MKRSSLWPPKDKAEALRLWSEGLSGTEVGLRFGKSRNSIIGLAHRNGLANDPKRPTSKFASAVGRAQTRALKPKSIVRPKIVAPKPKRERKMNVIVRPIPEVVEHLPNPTPLSMATDNQCRHIAGEPIADALICGAIVVPGTSWCPHHHARLFQPLIPSKRREPISTYRQYVVAA